MAKTFEEKLAEAKAQVSAISPQAASQRSQDDPGVVFIDPRNADDIRTTTGLIPGALNIALDQLDGALPDVLSDRARTIITACQAGPMGALAAHALYKRGYVNVQFMEGGTQGWLDAGFTTH